MTEVIVIGGANIDIKAKAERDLVPATSNPGHVTFALGGVARNIAHNLARLEVPVALISAVGSDAFGNNLLAQTEAAGVDCSMVLRAQGPTSSYVAILDAKGEMTVAVNAMPLMDRLTPDALAPHARRLDKASFILADCNLPAESLDSLSGFASKLIIEPVSVVKSEKVRQLRHRGIYALTLNRQQAENLCGLAVNSVDQAFAAAADLNRQGFERVVVTLGSDGAVASQRDGEPVHIPAIGKSSRDVTGGGDAAVAGLVFGLMQGLGLVKAAQLGQAAASFAVAGMNTVSGDLTRSRLLSLVPPRMDRR